MSQKQTKKVILSRYKEAAAKAASDGFPSAAKVSRSNSVKERRAPVVVKRNQLSKTICFNNKSNNKSAGTSLGSSGNSSHESSKEGSINSKCKNEFNQPTPYTKRDPSLSK